MKLHRWKTQFLGDVCVLDFLSFINLGVRTETNIGHAVKRKMFNTLWMKHTHRTYRFAFDPFCGQGTWSDRWSATECFEFGIHYLSILVNLDLENIKHSWSHVRTYTHTTCSKKVKSRIPAVSLHPHRQVLQLNRSPHSLHSYPRNQHFLGSHSAPTPSKQNQEQVNKQRLW